MRESAVLQSGRGYIPAVILRTGDCCWGVLAVGLGLRERSWAIANCGGGEAAGLGSMFLVMFE